MTTKQKMTLIVKAPEYLAAWFDVDAARDRLRNLKPRPGQMADRNVEHAAEVATKERSGHPLITNAQAAEQGGEVVYSARHDDPRQPPYSVEEIKAAVKAVVAAELFLADAEKILTDTDTPVSFDAFAAARKAGAKYLWWPQDQIRDPRRYRVRGEPVSDLQLQNLGPHALNNAVRTGAILEVPS